MTKTRRICGELDGYASETSMSGMIHKTKEKNQKKVATSIRYLEHDKVKYETIRKHFKDDKL